MLVDPESLTVLWANDPAAGAVADGVGDPSSGTSLALALPMAATMGVPEALRLVAATGTPLHLRADLVATTRGSASLVVSIYRLPDGRILLLAEDTWQARREARNGAASRPGRPGR
jgi:hypothetical protein